MKIDFGDVGIDVYPVGLLAALQHDWRMVTRLRKRPVYIARSLRYVVRQAWRGDWRAARMTFNGYLAEPTPLPPGLRRCGSGWTQRRALRSLWRHWPTA